jgi:hypothetical protein
LRQDPATRSGTQEQAERSKGANERPPRSGATNEQDRQHTACQKYLGTGQSAHETEAAIHTVKRRRKVVQVIPKVLALEFPVP